VGEGGGCLSLREAAAFIIGPLSNFVPNRVEFPRTVGKTADSALQAFSGVSSCEGLALAQSDMS
jgi:hypothetical protein